MPWPAYMSASLIRGCTAWAAKHACKIWQDEWHNAQLLIRRNCAYLPAAISCEQARNVGMDCTSTLRCERACAG